MDALEALEQDLQDGLTRLYDPQYEPSELLRAAIGCSPEHATASVQQAIIQAIKEMEPSADVPPTARIRRIFQVLAYRYVQGLTQEEAAERLGITPRHLRREQQQAISVLARRIWARSRAAPSTSSLREEEMHPAGVEGSDAERGDWRSQVRLEVAALRKGAPSGYADVRESLSAALELGHTLASRQGVVLRLGTIQPGLTAAVRHSALRQILVKTISDLLRGMSCGEVELAAEGHEGRIAISITASPAPDRPPDDYLMQELLASEDGAIDISVGEGKTICRLLLPPAAKTTVLVVDDNTDLVHFYRRYTEGTRYQIVHMAGGEKVMELAEEIKPEIIVLDIMLPDVDGWELLSQLHEHPLTRSVPVVVCSVVGEEELALALGAKVYLPKPVRRQQFLQALDQAVNQAAAGAPRVDATR